jgi:acetolactate synthase-1/2/3 large subunit
MKRTGAALVVNALEDEGVPYSFGIPGTHNIELYDALAASETVRTVLVTDEQSASFMADGLWRASGRLGCVNVVPGAGLTHALSGIAEAFLDNVPLLVLGCGIRRDSGRAFQLHDIDQQALVRPVVKESWRVERTADLYATVRKACQVARDGPPGPVFVEVPANLYMVSEEVDGFRAGPGDWDASGPDLPRAATPPGPPPARISEGVAAAANLLAGRRRPLLYLGAGARGAAGTPAPRLVELAEHLEAPVATTFQGKGVFPERHDLFLWNGFGDAAPPFVRKLARSCDAVLAVGCRFSEVGTGSYGIELPGPLVHVDLDPSVFHRNYPAEVTVRADGAAFVEALLETLRGSGDPSARRAPDESLRSAIREGHRGVWETWLGTGSRGRISPPRLLKTLQEHLGSHAIFATDSGNGTFLAVECLRLDAPGRFLAPVDYSCMGYAVPAALGAKLGQPDAPVVALAGDGAFLMTGLELISAARDGVGVLVLVLRDRELAQIAQFQETALSRKVSSRVADYDLEALARGMGVDYLSLASDDETAQVLAAASALTEAGKPVLVDVDIDYSQKTYFTRGVVKTTFLRLPLKDQMRFVGRAVKRRLTG